MKPTYIYRLIDPRTKQIRYVGKTVQKPNERLLAHIRSAKRGSDNHRDRWVRQLLKKELKPILEVIETAAENWPEREKYWIQYYREKGYKLTNLTDGGEGLSGHNFSVEHRARIAAAQIGNKRGKNCKHTKEFRETTRKRMLKNNPMKDHNFSEEHRRKLGEGHRGLRHSKETKEKMREAARKRNKDPEYIKKLSEATKRRWAENREEMLRITNDGKKAKKAQRKRRAREAREKVEADK